MQGKYLKDKHVFLKFNYEDPYFERDNIIFDKTCPNCGKFLFLEKDFCECGFFLKASKNSIIWSSIISVWLLIGISLITLLVKFDNSEKFSFTKFAGQNFNTLSPMNIQVISSLRNSGYSDYIQSIFIKPDEKNNLKVLIKPTLWYTLTENQKKSFLEEVQKSWEKVYEKNFPRSTKKPTVSFANSG